MSHVNATERLVSVFDKTRNAKKGVRIPSEETAVKEAEFDV